MGYKFTEPTDKEFKLLPEGEYIVEVVQVDLTINKSDDERELRFKIDGQPNKIFDSLIERENMNWKTDRFVSCMNMRLEPDSDGNCPFETHFTQHALVGLRGWVRIKIDEYQGKKRNKIDQYLLTKPKLPKHVVVADAPAEGF